MAKSDFFWTDLTQATERLSGTVVLYDGAPVYVEELIDGRAHDDGVHRARIAECNLKRETSRKKLNSPKFKKFRELPVLGWLNIEARGIGAVLAARTTMTTRSHGLNNNNVTLKNFQNDGVGGRVLLGGNYNFSNIMFDQGFWEGTQNQYPTLEAILANIENDSAIAYSNTFCVSRDNEGIRWLYRTDRKVGLFSGNDTLLLLNKYAYLREEIMEDKAFTLNSIREF